METQDHILFCPSYSDLRVDMNINNDMDLVNYVREVMKHREKNSKKKKCTILYFLVDEDHTAHTHQGR